MYECLRIFAQVNPSHYWVPCPWYTYESQEVLFCCSENQFPTCVCDSTSSFLILSTHRQHQIAQAQSYNTGPPAPTSDTSHKPRWLLVLLTCSLQIEGSHGLLLDCRCLSQVQALYFWPAGYKSEVPKTPSSGFINFLEQVTELKRNMLLIGSPVRYNRM